MQTVCPGSWLGLMLFGVLACGAAAAEPLTPTAPAAVASAVAPASPVTSSYVAGLGQSVGVAALAQFSGGTDVTQNMTLTGTVADNSADHVLTGANVISTGSFNGAAGLPMVIQNTGNNVLIQNATIVNVQFRP